jgi:hypothetical protein
MRFMKRLSLTDCPRHRDRSGVRSRPAESCAAATATVETSDANGRKKGASDSRLSGRRVTEKWTSRPATGRLRRSRELFAALLLLACEGLASESAGAEESFVWMQFAAQGLEARAATSAAACPIAEIDGVARPMTQRAAPDSAFPILVCATGVPRMAARVSVDGRTLPPPHARADRIAIIGDTGCRLKGLYWQECNTPASWPFRQIATTAAALAPHAIVHVGDYYYRETACPPLRTSCAGSPHGDNWEAWKADFFAPAGPLLAAAPWVFVRGNHENCARGGRGWARLLSPFPFVDDRACAMREPAYAVDLGGPTLFVLDVTAAEDRVVDATLAPIFAEALAIGKTVAGPVWYAFHKPIYSTLRVTGGESIGDNKTLAEAARSGLPDNVQAILSGHLHVFQIASYREPLPAQIVVGNGGDALDRYVPDLFDGLRIGAVTVERGRSIPDSFGFATLERGEAEWRVTAHHVGGDPLLRCSLRGREIACE